MKINLSSVYIDNVVWLVSYDTGYQDKVEFINRTFTSKAAAKEYIRLNKGSYINPKAVGLRLPRK